MGGCCSSDVDDHPVVMDVPVTKPAPMQAPSNTPTTAAVSATPATIAAPTIEPPSVVPTPAAFNAPVASQASATSHLPSVPKPNPGALSPVPAPGADPARGIVVPPPPKSSPLYPVPVPLSAPGLSRLQQVVGKYEMAPGCLELLQQLAGYEVVVIVDDSGSMGLELRNPNSSPFAKARTRWQELQERIVQIVEIATCLDSSGVDLFFLNRPPALGVSDIRKAAAHFETPPHGGTPLGDALLRAFSHIAEHSGKPTLIIIATDGAPNNMPAVKGLLRSRCGLKPAESPISVLVCSDNASDVAWIQDLDDGEADDITYFDVTDDYQSELAEVKKVQGDDISFSKGDYVAKCLLGGLSPNSLHDKLDSERFTPNELARYLNK